MDVSQLPTLNAILNSLATIFLIAGFILIKRGKKEGHRRAMTGALVCSAFFLISYLYYHYTAGHVKFPEAYPTARKIYLCILVPHIILAVVNLPLIILLVIAAIQGNFTRHKKLARITLPSWLFVSVTGVIIYLMLYQWFTPRSLSEDRSPTAKTEEGAAENRSPVILKEIETSGKLQFSPAKQSIRVSAEEKEAIAYIEVKNMGEEPILVNKLESGCSCLSVTMDPRTIPPGGSSRIKGVFSTEKLNGEADKLITVGTDQEGTHDAFLSVRLEVDPLYIIKESMTTWNRGGELETKIVRFEVKREDPIRVLQATSGRKEVLCELRTVKKGRIYELHLTPKSTDSSLLGMVRLETDCEIEAHARPLVYFSIQ